MIVIGNNPATQLVYSDGEFEEFLDSTESRFIKALDAKPGKGPITDIDALTDSVCDVPVLLRIVRSLNSELARVHEELDEIQWRMDGLEK